MTVIVIDVVDSSEVRAEVGPSGRVEVRAGDVSLLVGTKVAEAMCDALRFHQMNERGDFEELNNKGESHD